MQELPLREGEDFIRLGQALKKAGLLGMGSDAKLEIQAGRVKVNKETETRRGKKLVEGDLVTYGEHSFRIVGIRA